MAIKSELYELEKNMNYLGVVLTRPVRYSDECIDTYKKITSNFENEKRIQRKILSDLTNESAFHEFLDYIIPIINNEHTREDLEKVLRQDLLVFLEKDKKQRREISNIFK